MVPHAIFSLFQEPFVQRLAECLKFDILLSLANGLRAFHIPLSVPGRTHVIRASFIFRHQQVIQLMRRNRG
jgi:hypothetical protein